MSKAEQTRLAEIKAEVATIMETLRASHVATGIDNVTFVARPSGTDYIHFQLHSSMTSYTTAVAYMEGQLAKARKLAAEVTEDDQASKR